MMDNILKSICNERLLAPRGIEAVDRLSMEEIKQTRGRQNNEHKMILSSKYKSKKNMFFNSTNCVALKMATIFIITLTSLFILSHQNPFATATNLNQQSAIDQFLKQHFPQTSKALPLSQEAVQFDSTPYKSVYEAIKAHPDLREFAALCEARGVKEIVGMDKTQLTVFAPIDRSLSDLLAKVRNFKNSQINLIELAKHHIVQGLVMPNDETKYPEQFYSYAALSPLYLNSHSTVVASDSRKQQQQQQLYVNNARILATHLIPIDQDGGNYQALHIIDTPLDYLYLNKRQQIRTAFGGANGAAGSVNAGGQGQQSIGSSSSSSSSTNKMFATVKKPLSLDDLLQATTRQQQDEMANTLLDYSDRFGDLRANLAQADVCHARALRLTDLPTNNQKSTTPMVTKEALQFDQLARELRRLFSTNANTNQDQNQFSNLKRRLLNSSESGTLNTYFFPINSDDLQEILQKSSSNDKQQQLAANNKLLSAFEAHIIPDKVLFTRQLDLGRTHSTLLSSSSSSSQQQQQQTVALNLAKTIPYSPLQSSSASDYSTLSSQATIPNESDEIRRLLSTPLIVEAQTDSMSSTIDTNQQQSSSSGSSGNLFPAGLTSAEIILANIPLSNGVLHLIKRPLLLSENNLLDYINDNDNQLTNVVNSLGSRSGASLLATLEQYNGKTTKANSNELLVERPLPVQLNKFRELLARDRQLLATFTDNYSSGNRTILAPSDEAFSRLRYDLRALVMGDESMIPQHWDPIYRADLLERLLKRHIISDQELTSSQLKTLAQNSMSTLSAKGQVIQFKLLANNVDGEQDNYDNYADELTIGNDEQQVVAECDGGVRARLIHKDLVASNGILHILDRVLGEEQETLYTLIKSLVLKATNGQQQRQQQQESQMSELAQLIETRKSSNLQVDNSILQQQQQQNGDENNNKLQIRSPELDLISKTIGQYLDEMSEQKRAILSASVNISYQLAQLASRAENRQDEWSERFKLSNKQFTYFIPNDLAWLRLQQARPELYKPLVYFLEQQQQTATTIQEQPNSGNGEQQQQQSSTSSSLSSMQSNNEQQLLSSTVPRPSESSHRLLQILERHLVGNKKLSVNELGQLAQVQTLGATLRLVDLPSTQHPASSTLVAANQQIASQDDRHSSSSTMSAFAALHSIIGSSSSSTSAAANNQQQQQIERPQHQLLSPKALRLSSGNVAAANSQQQQQQPVANILQAHEASNGYVYLIDQVLLLPEDSEYLQQTSSMPNHSVGSTMSSLLGGHNSALLEMMQNFFGSNESNQQQHQHRALLTTLIGTLSCAIVLLALIVALVLVRKRRRQNKLNGHQPLESGLTSSSSANSGSTSTTKSL